MKQKIVLITGAAKGIGKAIAKEFLRNDFFVLINDKDIKTVKKTEIELKKISNNFCFIRADISNSTEVNNMIRIIQRNYKKVDVLVNNVGINIRSSFEDVTLEEWNEVFNTNLTSPFFLTQKLIPLINKNGNIIFTSSILGIKADSVSIQYGVSKAAVIMLAKYLAKILAPDIRVNCIVPGFVNTDWHKTKTEKRIKSINFKIPLKRFATPDEIAKVCLFLIRNKYIIGTPIVVDGGYLL